jgi:hypothetical protein
LERLRLETQEARERSHRPDPRLTRLERENERLRAELAKARTERDELESGVREAIAALKKG